MTPDDDESLLTVKACNEVELVQILLSKIDQKSNFADGIAITMSHTYSDQVNHSNQWGHKEYQHFTIINWLKFAEHP